MISDLDGYFLNATNERTCFASCARAFKISGLITEVNIGHFLYY